MKVQWVSGGLVTAAMLMANVAANGALVGLGPRAFTSDAAVIAFDEVPIGSANPIFAVNTPDFGVVDVAFGGHFIGQAATGGFPNLLSDTDPDGPLALDLSGPGAMTVNDGATPESPVMSGAPGFNGPIAILFSTPVAAVGLTGGAFDTVGSTVIEAYDVDGNSLGITANSELGLEFFGLGDSSGASLISGISIYLIDNEPAGFAIDNLTFGSAAVLTSLVPEPSSLLVFGLGLALLIARRPRFV